MVLLCCSLCGCGTVCPSLVCPESHRIDSSHLSGRNLVGETYQRAILEHAKVSIVRVKMAYATLSVYGKAR